MENKVNEIITNKIIEQLEKGNLKWLKEWKYGSGINYKTEKEYRGINQLLLNITLQIKGYKHNQWATFRQVQEMKGQVNAGEKATMVIYYKPLERCSCGNKQCTRYKVEKMNPEHRKIQTLILRYYNVFNVEQTTLKPLEIETKKNVRLEEVEKVFKEYWDLEKLKMGQPSYSPPQDIIYMPDINNFNSTKAYYGTLAHEIIHSTGHKDRLARKGITEFNGFGTEQYAYEELVAEIGSAFMCNKLNIPKDIENTSAYIQSWLKKLREDKTYIFKATREAQKAVEHVIGGDTNEEKETESQKSKRGEEEESSRTASIEQ